ncbi:hypothetical protein E4T56_gene1154 [Termitomyces sp. T112]|nr:hypothetical protein E4T56_gene1154 [Termitomyces sp. T112]
MQVGNDNGGGVYIAQGLVTLPRVATTPKGKGKGKVKARKEEEDEEIEKPIENSFTNKQLATLLCWQKALTVVDTGMGTGVVLEKAKRKSMVLLEERQAFKECQESRYWGNCQAFLAWQEANRVGKEDWEEGEMGDISSDNANLNL